MPSEAEVRDVVRRVLLRTLGRGEGAAPTRRRREVIDQSAVNALEPGSVLDVPPGSLVTPLARDAAQERKISLREGPPPPPSAGNQTVLRSTPQPAGKPSGQAVALGADHGGYELKRRLVEHLADLGYEPYDVGTDGTASVDYPDYAVAVARAVARGEAWRGIMIDGAGIGSAMAANKVPGVRAATCHNEATVVNSREHNNANVLVLGSGQVNRGLARRMVRIWLDTIFTGGRHARRVDKIDALDRS